SGSSSPRPRRVRRRRSRSCSGASGDSDARQVMRELEAPAWTETSLNYPAVTRRVLGPLMDDVAAVTSGGRLLLWHGPPGTGKTSALRTLGRQHPAALRIEYVLDPEAFFGRGGGYFVDVLFDEDEESEKSRL